MCLDARNLDSSALRDALKDHARRGWVHNVNGGLTMVAANIARAGAIFGQRWFENTLHEVEEELHHEAENEREALELEIAFSKAKVELPKESAYNDFLDAGIDVVSLENHGLTRDTATVAA